MLLVLPTKTVPKLMDAVICALIVATALPFPSTSKPRLVPLSVTKLTRAVRKPIAEGLNCTVSEQVAALATTFPAMQVPPRIKSLGFKPLKLTVVTV